MAVFAVAFCEARFVDFNLCSKLLKISFENRTSLIDAIVGQAGCRLEFMNGAAISDVGLPVTILRIVRIFIFKIKDSNLIDHPQSGVVYNFGRVCLCVCLYVCLSDNNFRKP